MYLPLPLLSYHMLFWKMAKTRTFISSSKEEVIPKEITKPQLELGVEPELEIILMERHQIELMLNEQTSQRLY